MNAARHLDRSDNDRRGRITAPPAWVAVPATLAVLLLGLPSPASAAPGDPPVAGDPAPATGATGVATAGELSVAVAAEDGADVAVTFHGREAGGAAEPFSIVVMPDTQNYTGSDTALATMQSQVSWILDQRAARNIRAVVHTGDILNSATSAEWARVTAAMTPLRRDDLALAVTLGNHDYDSILGDGSRSYTGAAGFDTAFPAASMRAYPWAGGYLGDATDAVTLDQTQPLTDRGWKDNYVLFSAGGVDMLIISAEFNIPAQTLQWVEAVLAQYPDRLAILSTHQWLEDDAAGTLSTQGASTVWAALRDNCNLRLVLSGHNHSSGGEAYRQETNTCGDAVQMHMADYQSRTNNGNGWLRLLTFTPETDALTVQTYSPLLGQWEDDADSAFAHTVPMASAPAEWETLGSTTVTGGAGRASVPWSGLTAGTEYEWYVDLDDGTSQASTSATPWTFTTAAAAPATPTGLALEADGAASAVATWAASTGATGYELAVDGDTAAPIAATGTSHTLTGLTPGEETCVQVRALGAGGASAWSAAACATPTVRPDWVAYIDTRAASGDGTSANALRWTSLPGSSTTTTLKDITDGAAIDGVGVNVTTSGSVSSYSNGDDAAAGTDAADEFGGIVDLAGVHNMDSGESMTLTFSGLDAGRSYTLVATSNRADTGYTARTTTFALQGADAFTNASSTGTTADATGAQVTFSTGNNTANGYVARWTGITPGADGSIALASLYGSSGGTSYGAGAVKLALEADPAAPPSTPANLVAGGASDTSVALSWAAVGSATSYELAIDGDTAHPITESGTSRTLTGLTTGVEVCAQVRARNANGVSAWSPSACATPGLWTAYVDTNDNGGGSAANALSLSSSQVTSGSTVALKDFSTGSALPGVQLVTASSGLTASTSGGHGVTPTGGDAFAVFSGKVNVAGGYRMSSSSTMTSTFTGLDPTRTYELVTTANRDDPDYTARTTTFALQDVDAFVNASSTGTGAAPTDAATTFVTGDNTSHGYVARWTGISPGADGDLVLASQFGTSSDTAYAAAAIMLRLEPAPVTPDTTPPVITLTGEATMTLSVGDTWTDPGATALDDRDGDLTGAIVVSGTVDTATAGTYPLDYDVSDAAGNDATTVTRTVVVEPVVVPDTTPPVITLTGEATMTLSVGDTWVDPGATALDDRDGDLTGAIVVGGTVDTATAGTYTVTYDVADAAGNDATTVTRTVIVEPVVVPDTTPPVITLTGLATVTVSVGDTWSDPGATALDDRDGDLTSAIVVGGTVDTATAGTYTVTYDVADAAGNDATTVTRTVIVEPVVVPDTTPPVITLTGLATVTVSVGDTWSDPGATALDDRDGDLTSAIVVGGTVDTATAGTYTVTYDVADAAGNDATTVTRTVVVEPVVVPDTTPPVITLTGLATVTLSVGDTWTDPGATATDDHDGTLTGAIVVTGTVSTATAGTYTLHYDVSDAAGNDATTVTRTVVVEPVVTPPPGAVTLEVAHAIVRALYADLLGRAPDPTGLAGWSQALLDGLSQAEVAARIMHSDEYFMRRIRQAYEDTLDRTADTAGARSWFAAARAGLIGLDDVQRGFLHSSEYFARAGGTPEGFVAALYVTVLHRTAGPGEIAGWVRAYAAHGQAAVADAIWFSLEARRVRTGGYYQSFLGRVADPGGLSSWVDVGRTQGEQRVRTGILGSTEYRNRSLLRFV